MMVLGLRTIGVDPVDSVADFDRWVWLVGTEAKGVGQAGTLATPFPGWSAWRCRFRFQRTVPSGLRPFPMSLGMAVRLRPGS